MRGKKISQIFFSIPVIMVSSTLVWATMFPTLFRLWQQHKRINKGSPGFLREVWSARGEVQAQRLYLYFQKQEFLGKYCPQD